MFTSNVLVMEYKNVNFSLKRHRFRFVEWFDGYGILNQSILTAYNFHKTEHILL